ncbi:hypothetical protein GCM10022393_19120 [Aquimarina addita]|uniref:DUF302 domain-containing protein n=1 Tax=Aquimarina addita TaxID=870485 RepID=A0ABP6UKD9_9FLAO
MKLMSLFIGLFFMIINSADMNQIRDLYKHAHESKENTDRFYELTKESDQQDPVVLGYYGCATALKASFADGVWKKLSLFKEGRKLIDKAIISAPNNIELRMIRLSVQYGAPKILMYYSEIENDKAFILNNVDAVSSSGLQQFIKAFIANSEVFKE